MIVPLGNAPDPAAARAAIEDIFFRSSVRRSFAGEAERRHFFATWTDWYLNEGATQVLLAVDGGGGITGYLTGCRDSASARSLFDTIPRYALFADLFDRFPAHLHINIHPDHRNRGLGTALIERFAAECACGIHIVTAPAARNVAFYTRCGFRHAVERDGLLFLGRI